MDITEYTEVLLDAKEEKGLTFTALGQAIGHDEVWVAALLYGQMQANAEEAAKIVSELGLEEDRETFEYFLTSFPNKGLGPVVPTDPLIYRLYEILQVFGYPFKSVVHEKFGDGIMSAIDFSFKVEKEEDPNGDRVKVIMSGKFLPYKKY
ncbi:MAG TPA: cyanase [Proteobacteria bacterium]|nr:cyanate hydratase [bacterium BMS3Abin14]HDL53241.1 cyanase [Pseudomonadota bacterium]